MRLVPVQKGPSARFRSGVHSIVGLSRIHIGQCWFLRVVAVHVERTGPMDLSMSKQPPGDDVPAERILRYAADPIHKDGERWINCSPALFRDLVCHGLINAVAVQGFQRLESWVPSQ
jgi:hypothetical protein